MKAAIFIGVWCMWIMAVIHITDHYWPLDKKTLQQELRSEIKKLSLKDAGVTRVRRGGWPRSNR